MTSYCDCSYQVSVAGNSCPPCTKLLRAAGVVVKVKGYFTYKANHTKKNPKNNPKNNPKHTKKRKTSNFAGNMDLMREHPSTKKSKINVDCMI